MGIRHTTIEGLCHLACSPWGERSGKDKLTLRLGVNRLIRTTRGVDNEQLASPAGAEYCVPPVC
jgi:hypothetical protein